MGNFRGGVRNILSLPPLVSTASNYIPQFKALELAARLLMVAGSAMLRPTTLLITMVLAGGPTGSLACELWCTSPAAEDHHREAGCHDSSEAAPKGSQLTLGADCHDDVATMPAVIEARHAESGYGGAVSAFFTSGSLVRYGGSVASWSAFKVQPPHASSSRAVLRV